MSKQYTQTEAAGYAQISETINSNYTEYVPDLLKKYTVQIPLTEVNKFGEKKLDKSPLHVVCMRNDVNTAKFLIAAKANPNEPTVDTGATSLMLAASAKGNTVPLLTLLIKSKGDIGLFDKNNDDAFNYALDSNNHFAQTFLTGVGMEPIDQ